MDEEQLRAAYPSLDDRELKEANDSPAIHKLYPTLTETERNEAEKILRRYFEIAVDIQYDQAMGPSGL